MTVADARQPLLQVRDLAVHFRSMASGVGKRGDGVIRAIENISFDIGVGETVGLVGESGCGKSTTGRAIVGLNRPAAGSIRLDGNELVGLAGEPLRRLRKRLQMIFQDPYASLNPRMTVEAIVREPLDIHHVGDRRERHDRVRELLDAVGLAPTALDRYPHQFSGGQKQRIGIARTLALNPDLIIADEPVSALDVSIQAQIINLLKRLQDRFDLTYLFIAHDLAVVRHISDRVMVMFLGRIVEMAPTAALYRKPVHPYTVALLSAIPVPDPEVEARRKHIILPGDVPSALNPPNGCRFHTRCWLRERLGRPAECETREPALRAVSNDHVVACHFAESIDGSRDQRQVTGSGGTIQTQR